MRSTLSSYEIESYRLNGFVVLPGFLDDDELHRWTKKAEAQVDATPARDDGRGFVASIRCAGFHFDDPEWQEMMRHPSLSRMAAELSGAPTVRHLGSLISYSYPGYPATPWHCTQFEYFPSDDRRSIAVQVSLDESTLQNKCMCFLPGTQLTSPLGTYRHVGPELDPDRTFHSIFELMPEWKSITPVAAECPAGSALFFSPAGVHGSGPNLTSLTRRYVGTTWIPAEATWNGQGSLSGAAAAVMQPGDAFDHPDYPIVWPR